jgi:GNAT superfamily N-acetyltransferase
LVIERGGEPPFFLEPDTPDAWVSHFTAAGFETLATYSSALARDLTQRDPRLDALAARLAERHIVIRQLDLARADDDLRRLLAMSLAAFKDNFLYTPIDEAEFMEQNRRILPVVRPELVLLAEQRGEGHDDNELVAFLFAVPDVLQQKRGQTPDTIIIKTVAVKPGLAHAGLGSLLVAEVQQRAAALGYTRAVHALMHESNVSRNISRRYAETIRRYALFAKRLTPPSVGRQSAQTA